MPERFPPYQTCHRRFQQWVKDGRLRKILEMLAQDLLERGKLDLSETFIDGIFVSAKKRGSKSERPSGGKGMKLMAVADGFGLPLAILTESASPHEVKLVKRTICERFTDERPKKMIGDKAYDLDPLDQELKKNLRLSLFRRIKPIANAPKRRTTEPCVATNGVGTLNGSLRGCKTFGE